MRRSVKLVACLLVTLFAVIALAQVASAQAAYVYVVKMNASGAAELDGVSADSSGILSPLPGSPFFTFTTSGQFWSMAHTAHWLFVSDELNIYSFAIASDGSVTFKSSINAQQLSPPGAYEVTALSLDHTGSTLYATSFNMGEGTGPNLVLAFRKDDTTGALTYLDTTDYAVRVGSDNYLSMGLLSFIGSNEYAYNAGCANGSDDWFGVHRNSDGTLTRLSISPTIPSNPNGTYCPQGSAADPTNNLAVRLFLEQSGPIQLAVYTADSSGNLTTNSTAENMPTSSVGYGKMAISPAGNLLAVSGENGLQVFHFNGSNPITPYTGRIAWRSIYDVAWDTDSHLYSVGNGAINVFTVLPNGYAQSPGSPHTELAGMAFTVLSKSTGTGPCAPPSTPGVTICSPTSGATVSSPVSVSAAATAMSGFHITAMRLYVDFKAVFTSTGNTLNTSVSLATGSHHLTVVGYQNNGNASTQSETIMVQ